MAWAGRCGVTTGLTTFGAAGVMKAPHAVAIHAIQVLPALAWLLSFAALPEPRRLGLVRVAVLGYAVVVVVVVSLLRPRPGWPLSTSASPQRSFICSASPCSAGPWWLPCSPSATQQPRDAMRRSRTFHLAFHLRVMPHSRRARSVLTDWRHPARPSATRARPLPAIRRPLWT
jgi:hypothetical protein